MKNMIFIDAQAVELVDEVQERECRDHRTYRSDHA